MTLPDTGYFPEILSDLTTVGEENKTGGKPLNLVADKPAF